MAFVCYRVVRTLPPTRQDFRSREAQGLRARPPERRDPRLYAGISVFESLAALEATRRVVPLVGAVVELRIPDGAPVAVHKTRGPGHWTLVGDPDVLLGYVTGVV